MNKIVEFIKDHPHCSRPGCTTCGGLLGFTYDLERWDLAKSPELISWVRAIKPDEISQVQNWPDFLPLVLHLIPESDRESAIFPFWLDSIGQDPEYDLFVLRHSPKNWYEPGRDEDWVRKSIIAFADEHFLGSEPFSHFLGDQDLYYLLKHVSPKDFYGVSNCDHVFWFLRDLHREVTGYSWESIVYPSWWEHFGSMLEYDLFALKFAPPGSYHPERDRFWIEQDINLIMVQKIEKDIDPLIGYLGENINYYPEFVEYYSRVQESRKKKEEADQLAREERRRLETLELAQREAEKKRIEELISAVSNLDSPERLRRVLEDQGISLAMLPAQWAEIEGEQLLKLNSTELTKLAKYLSKKMSRRQKGPWKKLRTQIYQIRQKVHNFEMGYSEVSKPESDKNEPSV